MQRLILFIGKILPVLALLLITIQFVTANEFAGYGETVVNIDEKLMQINYENNLIAEQLALARSLTVIEEKALTLGFSAGQYLSISPDQPVALK